MNGALVVWGGWGGHEPEAVAGILAGALEREGVAVELSDTLDALADLERLRQLDLLVPIWTMGTITEAQLSALCEAVRGGVGIGGCHGGMGDAFRDATEFQFLVGGQFVAHPGGDGVTYAVRIAERDHFVTRGLADFEVTSEQYYMHVDPSNCVLATTRFPVADGPHVPNGPVAMPVAWTRSYGAGRVFYCSLGHTAELVARPEVLTIMTRGLLWAASADE